MGLFVMVLMTISSLVLVSFMASTQDIAESQNAKDNGVTRAIGQDALSRFYAEFTTNEEFRADVIASKYDSTPFRSLDAVPFIDLTKASSSLPALGGECDYTLDGSACVKISVALQFYDPTNSGVGEELAGEAAKGNPVVTPQAIAVRADVFGQCPSGELSSTGCKIYGSFTQRIIPSQFYKYAFYNQYSVLDPTDSDVYKTPQSQMSAQAKCGDKYGVRVNNKTTSGIPNSPRAANECIEIAYQADPSATSGSRALRDVINGPLFSNDDYVLTCNSPRFEGGVYVNPTRVANPAKAGSALVYKAASASGCVPSATPEFNASIQENGKHLISLDTRMPNAANYTKLADALARAGQATVIESPTTTEVEIVADGTLKVARVKINGSTTVTQVINNFLYIKGNATVKGESSASLSVYASGTLEIVGDVTRQYCAVPAPGSTTADPCPTVIGLAAGGPVNIRQTATHSQDPNCPVSKLLADCGNATAANTPLKVQAILISLDSTVRVPGWGTYRWDSVDAPTLEFYGAIATKYQGVFGGYDQSYGNLISGFRKDFRFDRRLSEGSVNVPFLPSPISGDWSRLDFSEIPVR